MRKWSFRLTAALILPAVTMLPQVAQAQADFPVKTIRVIAPVPPGSPPDLVARVFADSLTQSLGQPVIVDNRPGANQTIGLGAVAASGADGYTLGVVSLPTAVVPSLMAKMPYDTLRDFAPVRELAWSANVLIPQYLVPPVAKAVPSRGRARFVHGAPPHSTAIQLQNFNEAQLLSEEAVR